MKLSNILREYEGETGRANQEARVSHGANAQKLIIAALKKEYGDRFHFISTAMRSSQVPDLIVEIDKKRTQLEVKSRGDKNGVMTMYTKTMWPGKRDPMMDQFANSFSGGLAKNFDELMELQKRERADTGWPNEKHTPKSGSLNIRVEDRAIISKVRRQIMRYLKASNDDYLAVVTRNTGDISFYELGPSTHVIEHAEPLPILRRVIMKTDGGADKGGMRIAVKIQLAK